jgi:MFS family permease
MGTNSMVAAIGLVLGPILGGALVAISWHWVFWFNVQLGLLGALWAALVLRELSQQDAQRSLDLIGTAVFVAGLTTAPAPWRPSGCSSAPSAWY